MSIKDIAIGGAVTLIIGGTAYTINQADVVSNFADDTGLTQEQAQEYVKELSDDDLIPFDELGAQEISWGNEMLDITSGIDCANYEYEWESPILSCLESKSQIEKFGRNSISLGQAYIRLVSDFGSIDDIQNTIVLIDKVNAGYRLDITRFLLDASDIEEIMKANSYNKSLLQATLESR